MSWKVDMLNKREKEMRKFYMLLIGISLFLVIISFYLFKEYIHLIIIIVAALDFISGFCFILLASNPKKILGALAEESVYDYKKYRKLNWITVIIFLIAFLILLLLFR